jgi:hypothetical protein
MPSTRSLLGDEVTDGSQQAYRIAASPPFFGIPFETARRVPQAKAHAPENVRDQLETGPGPRVADPSKLAASAISDDAAQAQAPVGSKDDPPLERSLERCQLQLDFLSKELAPWQADHPLVGAIEFMSRRKSEAAHDPKNAHRWTAPLAAQERTLYAVSTELTELLDDVTKTGAKAGDAAGLGPVVEVLNAYGSGGTS